MEKKRKYYIDAMKILCIFIVCFIHSGSSGFIAYESSTGIVQVLQLAFSTACKVCIPLFFMCTGALLLGREESIVDLWKNRVLKYIFITILFTLIYYIMMSIRENTPIDLVFILKTMYSTWGYSHSGSYWFLYSYIAFLILLPLLRIIARGLTKEIVLYMIVVNTVVCGVLPLLESSFGMGDWGVDIALITSDVFFYPFMGYYIEKCEYEKVCDTRNLLFCLGMSVLSIVTCVKFTLDTLWNTGISTQEFMGVFQLYIAFFVYIAAKMINNKVKISGGLATVIRELGMCTFGIYLIHGLVYVGVDDFLTMRGIPFTYGLAWIRAGSVFLISLLIVFVCRKIPILNKLF